MARARPGLEKAINEILERRGVDGKRLSYRQAERLTGLSTATISELAKGNARTPESLRRFAQALNEDATRLMLLAGFVPEEEFPLRQPHESGDVSGENLLAAESRSRFETSQGSMPVEAVPLEAEERACLLRLERALMQIPPGPDRILWKDHLSQCAALLERFAERGFGV